MTTESLHDYMEPGILHFMAFPECMGGDGPVLETLSTLAQDDFFEVIEVTRINDRDLRAQARAVADQARVRLCFGAQPVLLGGQLDLNHPNDEEREKSVEAVITSMDDAEELGCETLIVLSGKVTENREAAKGLLVHSLKRLCRCARTMGITVVLETFDQVDFGKNCLIGPTQDAVEVSQEVRKEFPQFGILLDLSHLPLQYEPPEQAVKTAGDHLVHVHIGNCAMDDPGHPAYGDNHPRFGAPGTRNDVPELTAYLRALLDSGYLSTERRGIVSFEVRPMPGEDPASVIAGSKRTLVEAWRRL